MTLPADVIARISAVHQVGSNPWWNAVERAEKRLLPNQWVALAAVVSRGETGGAAQ